jgi:hypothetical protein
MRRWLICVPVALAVLGVTGCLPGQVPVIVPVAVPSPSPTPTCPQVRTRLPERTDVSVTVYNGASRPGLANNVAEELTARGFKVLKVATSDRPYPQTLLRHGPDGLGAAWLLRAYFLDARTDYVATQQGASVDVLLGASFVKVPTPPEVNQAIAQHGTPVLPPGTCPG